MHARVGEQRVEAKPGAPVRAEVAGVEEALAVGLDEQRARVGCGVVDGDGGDGQRADAQWASSGSSRRSPGRPASGKKTSPTR